ncbi:MAG: rhomboid family intramembrane serine protease [Chthonomonas sp.]|nr:rhomboid family intramembrane serine protease [Chthonomonas sp.]
MVTYTLIALNVIIYLWDRNGALLGPSVVFSDLTMKPRDVVAAVTGHGDWKAMTTLFTSLFLHGNLTHLIGNLIFLLTFGENVEAAMGPARYTVMYLFWGLFASVAHVLVLASSGVPTLGASGAIGGVLGAYFLLFPANRITLIVFPFLFWPVEVAAWILLSLWFLWQIIFPQQGVANWAHAGGFLAGMLTVIIAGGPQRLLRGKQFSFDHD